MVETFLEITTTRLLKINVPAWQLFLKTLLQKCCAQYLGNYTDNTDGTYTYLSNYTDVTNWDCIHKYNEIKKYFQIQIDFLLSSYIIYSSLSTKVMLISILIDVQYLQNDVFLLWKRFEWLNTILLRYPPTDKKVHPSKIFHFSSTRGIFSSHPLTLFGKPWSVTYLGLFLAYH